jgi:arsenite oxidase small subunit
MVSAKEFWETCLEPEEKRRGRRRSIVMIIGAGLLAIGAVIAGSLRVFTGSPSTTTASAPAWPKLKAINAKSLEVLKPLKFNYPLDTTSNILVKLGVKAENGVGPDADIVAFSSICQHYGCAIGSLQNASQGYCSCHGSTYDFIHGGSIITGPTTQPVPQVLLEYDGATGDIYVVGMGPPVIYGHGPLGTSDTSEVLKYDLQGGQIVTEITLTPLS